MKSLTVEQVAARAGVPVRLVRELEERGQLTRLPNATGPRRFPASAIAQVKAQADTAPAAPLNPALAPGALKAAASAAVPPAPELQLGPYFHEDDKHPMRPIVAAWPDCWREAGGDYATAVRLMADRCQIEAHTVQIYLTKLGAFPPGYRAPNGRNKQGPFTVLALWEQAQAVAGDTERALRWVAERTGKKTVSVAQLLYQMGHLPRAVYCGHREAPSREPSAPDVPDVPPVPSSLDGLRGVLVDLPGWADRLRALSAADRASVLALLTALLGEER